MFHPGAQNTNPDHDVIISSLESLISCLDRLIQLMQNGQAELGLIYSAAEIQSRRNSIDNIRRYLSIILTRIRLIRIIEVQPLLAAVFEAQMRMSLSLKALDTRFARGNFRSRANVSQFCHDWLTETWAGESYVDGITDQLMNQNTPIRADAIRADRLHLPRR